MPVVSSIDALTALWSDSALPMAALSRVALGGHEPVFPSSFAVGTAAQVGLAAAGLAASELARARRGSGPRVDVDMLAAAAEASGWFSIDGVVPAAWDAFAGLYRCADGALRWHTNFAHHRDVALRLLSLDPASATREDLERAMAGRSAFELETLAATEGGVAAALRTFAQWDATPMARALDAQPLLTWTRLGDAEPRAWPALAANALPLDGLRVLDLTRILAGPVGGRTLAGLGAEVLLVNSPRLPNIDAIADTSRGKRSTLLDFRDDGDRERLWRLLDGAHVWSQGYRPGSLAALGLSPEALAARRPGLVVISLSAYGHEGPWSMRRGFDSLVQTAMGFNHAEGEAAGDGRPRPLPMQILDQASGYLIAHAAVAALHRQHREGGSWHVQVSLARTGQWLRSLGRVDDGLRAPVPDLRPYRVEQPSGYGRLQAIRSAVRLDGVGLTDRRPSMPPGNDPPVWSS